MNELSTKIEIETPALELIGTPGIYDLTHDQYHADPCAIPSLSCSIAKVLIRRTPRHAWQAHARFGNVGMVPTRVMDDGSTIHAMMLGQAHLIDPIRAVYGAKHKNAGKPVTDYLTNDAKAERDEIREMGRIPVLHHRLPELIRCKTAALRQLESAEDGEVFLAPGRNEVCAVSREDDVLLRCLVDRLPDAPILAAGDLKCTEMSASPGGWDRRLQTEYAFQDAFYRRTLRGAEGFERPPMRFGVIELDPPHGTVIMSAAETLRTIAEAEVERAIQLWRRCMRANEWPFYGTQTNWIEAAGWQIAQNDDFVVGAPATFGTIKIAA
jgi:hypothetical protein